jgi:pyroglutamyl-peptidase
VTLFELAALRGQFCFQRLFRAKLLPSVPFMRKPKRILIYGFGPYREFRNNITARIVHSLPPRAGLKKIVFPVRFHRKQFVDAIDQFKPEIILGLGQSSRRTVAVETQAVNRRRGRSIDPAKAISRSAPETLKTTLRLRVGRQAGRSSDAGDYVCNFSMYVMLEHIRRSGANIRYGFMHIPHDYELAEATKFVKKIVRQLSVKGAS